MTQRLNKKNPILSAICLISFLFLGHESFGKNSVEKNLTPHNEINKDTIVVEDIKTGIKRKLRVVPSDETDIDTNIKEKDSQFEWNIIEDKSHHKKTSKNKGRGIFGVSMYRVDLGFTRPLGADGFSMEGANDILSYRPSKTLNFGFDIVQAGYRFNKNFRVFVSGGFDWTYYRLKNNVIFDPNKGPYSDFDEPSENLSKNRLTSTYLRIPLAFEFRTNGGSNFNSTKISVGPIAGFLMNGSQRYRQEGTGKVKRKGDYDLTPFQYGVFSRFYVGNLGLFGKYYFNDIFEHSPEGSGLQNFTFGLSLGF